MDDIAEHIRIFEPNPDDDFVTKREAAIKVVATKLGKKRNFNELLALADDVSTALFDLEVSDSPICDEMVEALKAKSPSFSPIENTLQIAVCAALAVLRLIRGAAPADGRVTTPVFLGFAIWSGLSHRKPIKDQKLENLRGAILDTARELTLESATLARERDEIPELKMPARPAAEEEDTTSADFNAAAKETIGALKSNAALDREELDLLWWVLGNWSDIAQNKVDTLPELSRAIISGIEVSEMLRRVPGDAHRHLVIRAINEDKEITLKKVLTELGAMKDSLANHFSSESKIAENKAVLPLLNAICADQTGSSFGSEKLKVSDWGSRALVEGALLRMINLPVSPL